MEKDDEGWRRITWIEGLQILADELKKLDERLTALETFVDDFHEKWMYEDAV